MSASYVKGDGGGGGGVGDREGETSEVSERGGEKKGDRKGKEWTQRKEGNGTEERKGKEME